MNIIVNDLCEYPMHDLLLLRNYFALPMDSTIADIAVVIHGNTAEMPVKKQQKKPQHPVKVPKLYIYFCKSK